MLKVRVISILTFNGLSLVKTNKFSNPRMIGNPIQVAKVFNSRNIDELIFLDINATSENRKINLSVVKKIMDECYMPVGIGGGIKTIQDIQDLLNIGADKVIIKSQAIIDPAFILEASNIFGSQCISISVDVIEKNGKHYIYNKIHEKLRLEDFVLEMERQGAGELIINSVDKDGTMSGFNIELCKYVQNITNLPLVAVGGGGDLEHYKELFLQTTIQAVGSSSIFAYTRYTPNDIKRKLFEINIPVRNF